MAPSRVQACAGAELNFVEVADAPWGGAPGSAAAQTSGPSSAPPAFAQAQEEKCGGAAAPHRDLGLLPADGLGLSGEGSLVPCWRCRERRRCLGTDPMAQKREDPLPPDEEEAHRASPGPESALVEDHDRIVFHNVPQGSSASQSASGQAGIIESIQLENFMCQAVLGPIPFGSGVNFVVGQEGKKELVTALVLALGGKSLRSSWEKFVKDGEDLATISITLRNQGKAAFKADLYGNSIRVEHYITDCGTASYALKDQAGKLVSSEEEEWTAILNHFKIQVDNPMSVLQQEMGGQLLQTTNDGDRYKFFLKVMELEEMNNDYLYLLERKSWTQKKIEEAEWKLQELKQQDIVIKDYLPSMTSSEKRIKELKLELAWALVNESEREIEVLISNITLEEENATIINQKLEACWVKFNEASKTFNDMQVKLQQLTEEAAELEITLIQAEEDMNRKEIISRKAAILYHSFQYEFKGLDKAKEEYDQTEALIRNVEQVRLEKQAKMFTLRGKLKNFKDQEDSLAREMRHLQDALEKEKNKHSQLRDKVSHMQQKLNDEQRQLARLRDCQTDPLKRFGPPIAALLEAVDNAYRQGLFTTKPIGPLGAYIHVQDPEFALAIESCLRELLVAFCCDNHKDKQVLQKVMEKVYPPGSTHPQIIVSAFQTEVRDVTDRAAIHPEFPTVLTCLEITNAVVANALIDVRGIESVLLIKSISMAHRVIQAESPPKNCSEVFTAEGHQLFAQYYYSCEKLRPTFFIDEGLEISHLEKKIENIMGQLSMYQQHVRALENNIRKNQDTIYHHHLCLKALKGRERKINIQISDLANDEKRSKFLSFLETKAQKIKKYMEEVDEKMNLQTERMKNAIKQKLDAEQRHKNIQIQIGQVRDLTESFKQELKQVRSEMDVDKEYMLHYRYKLNQHLDSLKVKKEELTMKEQDLEREIAQAQCVCPERQEIKKAPAVLDREIHLLEEKIKSENSIPGSREDMRQFEEVEERYEVLHIRVRNLKKRFKSLVQTSTETSDMYQQLRRGLALRCKGCFDNLLSQWPYSGEMNFDHTNETLSIRVQPKEGNEAAFGDMDFLSLSNFFFILTLWSITESPFRCLDTLDMYMDSVSRRIAMDMIVRMAQSRQSQQFILLTPQSVSFLPPSPVTRIVLLPDEERDQRTLPFQQVSEEEEP